MPIGMAIGIAYWHRLLASPIAIAYW